MNDEVKELKELRDEELEKVTGGLILIANSHPDGNTNYWIYNKVLNHYGLVFSEIGEDVCYDQYEFSQNRISVVTIMQVNKNDVVRVSKEEMSNNYPYVKFA